MSVEVLRDIVIIISGITFTVCSILAVWMVFSFYKRWKRIVTLTEVTLTGVQQIVHEAGEVIRPVAQVIAVIDAAAKGVDLLKKIFAEKIGGEKNEQRTMG